MVASAGMSDDAVKAATGRDWAHWRRHLDAAGAAELAHIDIARLLYNDGVPGWWSQMVTVGYERKIGKRAGPALRREILGKRQPHGQRRQGRSADQMVGCGRLHD